MESRPQLLFVDDESSIRVLMPAVLARHGFQVTAAGTVSEALNLIATHHFDVLVSDLGLPDGDGCMLLRELRKRQPKLAGIVVSGHGLDSDIERTRSAGFAEHLTKPVSVDALKQAFVRLLGKK